MNVKQIQIGAVIEVDVRAELFRMEIVDIRDGRVVLSYPKGTKRLKRGCAKGRWWLPIDFVKANARKVCARLQSAGQ